MKFKAWYSLVRSMFTCYKILDPEYGNKSIIGLDTGLYCFNEDGNKNLTLVRGNSFYVENQK